MKLLLVAVLLLLCVGCAITGDKATTIATREVHRRGLPLPDGYSTSVTRVYPISDVEVNPVNAFWKITFSAPHVKNPLYEVDVDEYSQRIRYFFDWKHHQKSEG
jgi:hypothetical protein